MHNKQFIHRISHQISLRKFTQNIIIPFDYIFIRIYFYRYGFLTCFQLFALQLRYSHLSLCSFGYFYKSFYAVWCNDIITIQEKKIFSLRSVYSLVSHDRKTRILLQMVYFPVLEIVFLDKIFCYLHGVVRSFVIYQGNF